MLTLKKERLERLISAIDGAVEGSRRVCNLYEEWRRA